MYLKFWPDPVHAHFPCSPHHVHYFHSLAQHFFPSAVHCLLQAPYFFLEAEHRTPTAKKIKKNI